MIFSFYSLIIQNPKNMLESFVLPRRKLIQSILENLSISMLSVAGKLNCLLLTIGLDAADVLDSCMIVQICLDAFNFDSNEWHQHLLSVTCKQTVWVKNHLDLQSVRTDIFIYRHIFAIPRIFVRFEKVIKTSFALGYATHDDWSLSFSDSW